MRNRTDGKSAAVQKQDNCTALRIGVILLCRDPMIPCRNVEAFCFYTFADFRAHGRTGTRSQNIDGFGIRVIGLIEITVPSLVLQLFADKGFQGIWNL